MHYCMDVSCERSLLVSQFLLSNHCTKKANPTWNYLNVATKINKGRQFKGTKSVEKSRMFCMCMCIREMFNQTFTDLGRLHGQSRMQKRRDWHRYFLSVCISVWPLMGIRIGRQEWWHILVNMPVPTLIQDHCHVTIKTEEPAPSIIASL